MNTAEKHQESPNTDWEKNLDFAAAFAEEDVHYRDYAIEDYATFLIFWALIIVVFIQFFTRYVLGDSTTWTEEIARYLLIAIAFLGSAMAVRKNAHIAVEFFHRYLPAKMLGALSYIIEIINILFYLSLAGITWQLASRTMGMMVSIDLPKKYLYYLVFAGFLLMLMRSIQRLCKRCKHKHLEENAHV